VYCTVGNIENCVIGLGVGWAAGVAYKESLGPKQKMNCDFNELKGNQILVNRKASDKSVAMNGAPME
jgi:hypothetical protein